LDAEQKSLKFLLEMMTLVSSKSNIGSDAEFVLRGRTFIYITNNRGHRICPWGTPCYSVAQLGKTFLVVLGEFSLTCCLLLVKWEMGPEPIF
jgi:hypothetical protein